MPKKERQKVQFHYIKSPRFGTIHVDGLIGGPTPRGDGLHLALYSERVAIPQQTEFYVNPDGSLGEPVPEGEIGRQGIVREMQVDAVMWLAVAKSVRDWLAKTIEKTETERKKGRKR